MTTQTDTSAARVWPPRQEVAPVVAERAWERYFARHPAIAQIDTVAGHLAETIGPMCWAALLILYGWAMMAGGG